MRRKAVAAVVFDCDGVLLVSNTLKVQVFREALAEHGFHPEDIARFSHYQTANFGTSRYRLFEHFLTWDDLKTRPEGVERDVLVGTYARLLRGRYTRCATTPGMREVLDGLAARGLPLFVVSVRTVPSCARCSPSGGWPGGSARSTARPPQRPRT